MAKEITNNGLATLIKKGFDQTATKEDLKRFATKDDLNSVKSGLNSLWEHFDHRIDGLELKLTAYAGSWTKDFAKLHEWVKELDERLSLVEKGK